LLAGMWEFPNARVEGNPHAGLASALRATYSLKVRVKRATHPLVILEHAYSHFTVTVHALRCELIEMLPDQNLKWVSVNRLDDYPMGKIDRQVARKI